MKQQEGDYLPCNPRKTIYGQDQENLVKLKTQDCVTNEMW